MPKRRQFTARSYSKFRMARIYDSKSCLQAFAKRIHTYFYRFDFRVMLRRSPNVNARKRQGSVANPVQRVTIAFWLPRLGKICQLSGMTDTGSNGEANDMLDKGRRIFKQLAFGSIALAAIVLSEELITWNAPAFIIGIALILVLLSLLWWLVAKGRSLRWILFGALLLAAAYTFLLGGLHLTDIREHPLDPLCYWLVGAGMGFLGMGGFSAYSPELDAYLKSLSSPI